METALKNFTFSNLVLNSEYTTNRKVYSAIIKDKGISMASITYRRFAYGEPIQGGSALLPYRKFFYDTNGCVIKKIDFSNSGEIETKVESIFSAEGKILASIIYTSDNISKELYEYCKTNDHTNGLLNTYSFNNVKWPRAKNDKYEYDKFGRKNKKISFGLIGQPELITEYLYDKDYHKKLSYRRVTTPEGKLVLTLLYCYDDDEQQNQIAVYSFLKPPDEIKKLRNDTGMMHKLKTESISSSIWEFDDFGNHISFVRDEMLSEIFKKLQAKGNIDRLSKYYDRIVTEKYTNEFKEINKLFYLVKTTEWQVYMNEPLQAVKEYTYYDKEGDAIYL